MRGKKVIHKIILDDLKIGEWSSILFPINSQFLCVQNQFNHLVLWYELYEENCDNLEEVIIGIFFTDHSFDDRCKTYIGTMQKSDLIYHVYYIRKEDE